MEFLQKYAIDIGVIIGMIMSTVILIGTVDVSPIDIYAKHFITCVGLYTLTQVIFRFIMFRFIYFVYRKIKR